MEFKGKIRLTICMLTGILMTVTTVNASELEIVGNGKSDYVIAVPEKAAVQVSLAAEELKEYFKKVTGADIEIKKGKVTNPKTIYIGPNPALPDKAEFKTSSYKDDGFLIAEWKESVVIMGADEEKNPLKGSEFGNFGILYGTYEFIERFLGVRWYSPGRIGECFEKKKNVAVSGLPIKESPVFSSRTYWPVIMRLHSCRDSFLWGRRMRYMGSKAFNPNHSMQGIGHYYKDKRPEIFALLPGGQREFGKRDPQKKSSYGWISYPQFCFSNPATAEVYMDAVDEFYKETEKGREIWSGKYGGAQPTKDYIYIVPDDNFSVNMCHCPECRKLLTPDRGYLGMGSDLVWGFVAKLAEKIKKKYPDKKVGCLAYNSYFMPPENVKLPDNVVVRICVKPWFMFLGSPENKKSVEKLIKDWIDTGAKISFWQYYMPYSDVPWLMPGTIVDWYRKYRNNAETAFIELTHTDEARRPMNFPIHGRTRCTIDLPQVHMNLYLTMKALWNPDAVDVKKEMDDYYRLFYGPAAEPMRKYNELVIKRWENAGNVESNTNFNYTAGDIFEKIYPFETVKELDSYLKDAKKIAGDSIYGKRIDWLREGYFDEFFKLAESYNRYSKENRAQAETVSEAPVIDGKLDDPAWKNLQTHKMLSTSGPVKPRYPTNFMICRDDKNIYIGIEASDPQVKSAVVTCKEQDSLVFTDDSIELFLVTDPKKPRAFYQIIVNLAGTVFDRQVKSPKESDKKWSSNIRSKAITGENSWTMEIALPLKSLGAEKIESGRIWKMNLCRNKKSGVQETMEQSQWVPTFGAFCRPEEFGEMLFSEKAVFFEDFDADEKTVFGFNHSVSPGKRERKDRLTKSVVEDGILKTTVDFPEDPMRNRGSFAFINLSGAVNKEISENTFCELRFLNPHKDTCISVVYTIEDETGKRYSDFYRICNNDPSEKWRTRTFCLTKDGVRTKAGKKTMKPGKLKYLSIFMSTSPSKEKKKQDFEFDYIRLNNTK